MGEDVDGDADECVCSPSFFRFVVVVHVCVITRRKKRVKYVNKEDVKTFRHAGRTK